MTHTEFIETLRKCKIPSAAGYYAAIEAKYDELLSLATRARAVFATDKWLAAQNDLDPVYYWLSSAIFACGAFGILSYVDVSQLQRELIELTRCY